MERFVIHDQANDFAVRDINDRLSLLGVAVAALGIRQRALVVDAVEIATGE